MKKEILAIRAENVRLEPGLSHRATTNIAALLNDHGIEWKQQKTEKGSFLTGQIMDVGKSPLYFIFGTEKKALQVGSIDMLCNIMESPLWSSLKGATDTKLNEVRKNPVANVREFSQDCGIARNHVYKQLDQLAKDFAGVGYESKVLKKKVYFLDAMEEVEEGGQKYTKPIFSMSFMEDVRAAAFLTNIPKEAYRRIGARGRMLDRYLREHARTVWQNTEGEAPKEYAINVGTLFSKMNRPKNDKNRRDKERIQKPFFDELELLFKNGIFIELPFFRVHGTKPKISFESARKTTWREVLNLDLVYKIPEPGPKEVRDHNRAFKAKAALTHEKKAKAMDAKIVKTPTIKTVKPANQMEDATDFI